MIYNRMFRFSASHYGPWHHKLVWEAKLKGFMDWTDLVTLMSKLHGHNFRVGVSFQYDESEAVFGVWDELIEGVVMEWANCNISMHPDLFREEWVSSTEITASTLAKKLLDRFPNHVNYVIVTLWETNDIHVTTAATREGKCSNNSQSSTSRRDHTPSPETSAGVGSAAGEKTKPSSGVSANWTEDEWYYCQGLIRSHGNPEVGHDPKTIATYLRLQSSKALNHGLYEMSARLGYAATCINEDARNNHEPRWDDADRTLQSRIT